MGSLIAQSKDGAEVLAPHHLVHREGRTYLIHTEAFLAFEIGVGLACLLEFLVEDPAFVLTSEQRGALRRFGLLQTNTPQYEDEPLVNQTPINSIALFVNQECNMGCVYCYGDGGRYGDGGMMTEETAQQAVDWLIEQSKDDSDLQINFFGGEPLLSFPLIQSTIEYSRRKSGAVGKKMHFGVSTNGTLLDDDKIDFFEANDIQVGVSFDGPKEIQDQQRPINNGASSYDVTLPKLKKLLRVLPDSHVQAVTVGRANVSAIEEELVQIGFKNHSVSVASPMLFEGGEELPERDVSGLIAGLDDEAASLEMKIKKNQAGELKNHHGPVWQALRQFLSGNKRKFHCNAGRNYVGVSAKGDTYLCHRFVGNDEHKVGDIYSQETRRRPYQRSNIELHQECRTCYAKYTCGGGCYHDNYSINGSDFEPDEQFCQIQRHTAELAAVLSCRLSRDDINLLADLEFIPRPPCPVDLF